jgi:predicted nuclease of predicted toxin-antitoxin system
MKWLFDEMLPAAAGKQLVARGHDAVSVHDLGLAGAADEHVFERAVHERRVLVTENFADYALILEHRTARGEGCVTVVFVRKAKLSRRGGLAVQLARQLDAWSRAHPDPYLGPHWA